jgi:hypothetical protein
MWGRAEVAAPEAAALEGSEGSNGNHHKLGTVEILSVYFTALIIYLQHVSAQVYHLQGAQYDSFKSQLLFKLAYCAPLVFNLANCAPLILKLAY